MRVNTGSSDQFIYFVAIDSGGSRLTGLSSFTVYRSRNGGAAPDVVAATEDSAGHGHGASVRSEYSRQASQRLSQPAVSSR